MRNQIWISAVLPPILFGVFSACDEAVPLYVQLRYPWTKIFLTALGSTLVQALHIPYWKARVKTEVANCATKYAQKRSEDPTLMRIFKPEKLRGARAKHVTKHTPKKIEDTMLMRIFSLKSKRNER